MNIAKRLRLEEFIKKDMSRYHNNPWIYAQMREDILGECPGMLIGSRSRGIQVFPTKPNTKYILPGLPLMGSNVYVSRPHDEEYEIYGDCLFLIMFKLFKDRRKSDGRREEFAEATVKGGREQLNINTPIEPFSNGTEFLSRDNLRFDNYTHMPQHLKREDIKPTLEKNIQTYIRESKEETCLKRKPKISFIYANIHLPTIYNPDILIRPKYTVIGDKLVEEDTLSLMTTYIDFLDHLVDPIKERKRPAKREDIEHIHFGYVNQHHLTKILYPALLLGKDRDWLMANWLEDFPLGNFMYQPYQDLVEFVDRTMNNKIKNIDETTKSILKFNNHKAYELSKNLNQLSKEEIEILSHNYVNPRYLNELYAKESERLYYSQPIDKKHKRLTHAL